MIGKLEARSGLGRIMSVSLGRWMDRGVKLCALLALSCLLLPGLPLAARAQSVASAPAPELPMSIEHFSQPTPVVSVLRPKPVDIALAGPMMLAMSDLKPHFSYQWLDETTERRLSIQIEPRYRDEVLSPEPINLTPWRSGSEVLNRLKNQAVFTAFSPNWQSDHAASDLAQYSFASWQTPDAGAYDLGPFTARLLSANNKPGGLMGPATYQPSTSPFVGSRDQLDDNNPNAAYLAMEWRTGSLGLSLGGGYAGSNLTTVADAGGASRGGTMRSSSLNANSSSASSRYDASSRWAAFMSVPYRLSESISFGPEFTYYYLNAPAESTEVGNEWVMGLQMKFDF